MTGPADPIRRTRLDSGIRLVSEALPGLRSASIGFWVGVGAREEPEGLGGASHFLEHLLFKGTASRSARDIAEAIDSIGGDMNAFTAQELTAFTVRVPHDAVELAIEILSDIMWAPSLRPDDVDAERQVILEEIRARDDSPDDLVHDLFAGAVFPGHPLGADVLGSRESIVAMTRDQIAGYHATRYLPSEVVVAAAGLVDHDQIAKLLDRLTPSGVADRRAERVSVAEMAPPAPTSIFDRACEQAHIVLGARGFSRDDPDRFAMMVLDHAFGSGMSSRLFQEIREDRGLAYSVYSYRAAYRETGLFAAYAGTAPEHAEEVLGLMTTEYRRLVDEGGLTEREVVAAKGNLLGSLALALESSASRMHRLGRFEVNLGEIPSLDEVAAHIEAVTVDDVARVVDRVFAEMPTTLAVVGPFEDADLQPRVA